MSSSTIVGSATKHGHRLVYVVAIQSLVILWLAAWTVGDYLNNVYVHDYVDGEIAAYGLFVLLGLVLGSVGGGYGLIHRRHKLAGSSVGLDVGGAKAPKVKTKGGSEPSIGSKTGSTLAKAVPSGPALSPGPSFSAAPKSIDSIIASVSPPAESGVKPSGELHPAVAALKAEMSQGRVNLGMMSAAAGQSQGPAPVPSSVGQPGPVPERQMLNVQPGPPQPGAQMMPVRPVQPMPVMRPPMPQQGVRPMQPFPFGRPLQGPPGQTGPQQPFGRPSQPGGNERFEDAARKAGFQLSQGQQSQPPEQAPSQPSPPSIPRNVTTVITGIVPVKKKDDEKDDRSSQ